MDYFKDRKNILIDEKKIREYLLNVAHPDGGGKARYFISLGYSAERWEYFARDLLNYSVNAEIVQILSTRFGLKFILDGYLEVFNGDHVFIRSVWIVKKLDNFPILVTAYPLKDDKRV